MIIPTHTIVHLCLDSNVANDISDIPKILCNKKQARKSLKTCRICITDTDHD